MTPIPKTFFITGLGRSGTAFLASVLNRSSQYHVVHEWKVPRTPFRDGRLQKFPLWRFYLARHPFGGVRPGYGEVNSHLRRTLDAGSAGREVLVEKRGVILRDPRDIVASGMNRNGRTEADFPSLCEDKVSEFARLLELLDHPTLHYEPFEFRRFTAEPDYIRQIAEWAGIGDLDVPPEVVARKVNVSERSSFPRWRDWTAPQRKAFEAVADRYGVMPAIQALVAPEGP